jgi:hypothetical protein
VDFLSLEELFSNPPSPYRGKPFWAWNGRLTEQELRRQIRVFSRMGLGGAFMHSRVGLATEYLSEEWFHLVDACIDECRKNRMEAWLYDEDRWPSGAAGGLVTKDPRFRQRILRLSIGDPADFEPQGDELGLFLARIEGSNASGVKAVDAEQVSQAKEGDKLLVFKAVQADPSPWYNDYTYLDTMSKEAVAKFIETTHEAYAKSVGEEFGKTVPGIFTDEPNYGGYDVEQDGAHAPWSNRLPEVFRERYGYDIVPHLPEIFFRIEGEDFSRVRYHYRDCITEMFVRSFAEQIGEWCGKHDLLFTGHVLAEENLLSQTSVVGSAMRFYEFMQAPGIDILRGEILSRPGGSIPELATAKQCSSVAHQFGRKWMLSELYGCTGWNFTFGEQKAVGDWQAALGVNLRCQHLSFYTMLGQAKRDYPASISFQSPWWRDYGLVEDYFGRVGVLMTQGEPVRDLAVLHPIESAWGLFCGRFRDSKALWELNNRFEEVQRVLLEEGYDFDYVDEDILARHGSVAGKDLALGRARYKALLVPPVITLRSTTLAIIRQLREAGLPVIFVNPTAVRINGEKSERAKEEAGLSLSIALDRDSLLEALADVPELRRVSIRGNGGEAFRDALTMFRHDEESGRHFCFICHTRQDRSTGPLSVSLPAQGQAQEWDAETGEIFLADQSMEGDGTVVKTEMHGAGSRLFVVDPKARDDLQPRTSYRAISRTPLEPGRWRIVRDEPNAVPLDYAMYSLDGGDWKGPTEVLQIDDVIRDAAGLRERGGRMVQPWAQTSPPEFQAIRVRLRFSFHVERMPAGPCHLVMEQPDRWSVTLNGHAVERDQDEGWWIDPAFQRIRIGPGMLKIGENAVEMEPDYLHDTGIETIYLTGEFGARWDMGRAVISALPEELELGDWTERGFPCYTGSITYRTQVERPADQGKEVFLEIPSWEGVLAKVRINGKLCGRVAWPPYRVRITSAMEPGSNEVAIEMVASRRNLLGPLHLSDRYPTWTGAGQFKTSGDEWTDDYVKLPYGLMEPPVISVEEPES